MNQDEKINNKKTILLTGATGFLGSFLLEKLLAQQYQVVILKRISSPTWRIASHLDKIKCYDLEQVPLEQLFQEQQIEAVIHTATTYGRKNESVSQIFESNFSLPLKLLELALRYKVGLFLNTDTFFNEQLQLPDNLNHYVSSKKQFLRCAQEQVQKLVPEQRFQLINLKIEQLYGPKDSVEKFVPSTIKKLLLQEPLDLTLGAQKRDFVYVEDAAAAYCLLLKHYFSGADLHDNQCNQYPSAKRYLEVGLGSGTAISIRDFVLLLKELSSSQSQLNFGALPYRQNEIMDSVAEAQQLRALGWKEQYSLTAGLQQTINYYRCQEQQNLGKSTILAQFYQGKKVLITGHTGFKGGWLTLMLQQLGAKVSGYSLPPAAKPNLFTALGLQSQINNHFGDVRDLAALQKVLQEEQPEIIFHLAAQPLVLESYKEPLATYEINTLGSAKLLEAVRQTPAVRAVVMITTDKVYENKDSIWAYREHDELGGYDPYSSSKACAELVIKSYVRAFFHPDKYGTEHQALIASVRAGNVIGGGDWAADRLVSDIIRSVFELQKELVLRYPQAVRPWQFVLDPLLGYLLLAQKLYTGQKEYLGAWNFSPEESSLIPVGELVQKGFKALGLTSGYSLQAGQLKHETTLLKLDATKAKTLLAWKPQLNIDETIRWTFSWYQNYYQHPETILAYSKKQMEEYFQKDIFSEK